MRLPLDQVRVPSVPLEAALEIVYRAAAASRGRQKGEPPLSLSSIHITDRGVVTLEPMPMGAAKAAASVHGTMAPLGEEGREADVYALGSILYRLIVGAPLGSPGADAEHHDQLISERMGHLGHLAGAGRSDVIDLLDKMLAFRAVDRPGLERAVATLQEACAHDGPRALKVFAQTSIVPVSGKSTETPAPVFGVDFSVTGAIPTGKLLELFSRETRPKGDLSRDPLAPPTQFKAPTPAPRPRREDDLQSILSDLESSDAVDLTVTGTPAPVKAIPPPPTPPRRRRSRPAMAMGAAAAVVVGVAVGLAALALVLASYIAFG